MTEKILVTGPFGQIGSELVPELQKKHGPEHVIALGHHHVPPGFSGILEQGSVTDAETLRRLFDKYRFTTVYHLAGILSAVGEQDPALAWEVNMAGLKNVLDLARDSKARVFWASSIAVFGPTTPRDHTPQRTVLEPTTMYGATKVAGELLCFYYFNRYGLDVRSLRYPGLISYQTPPGGGTTDYAVAIFFGAIQQKKYECFVSKETVLPMMYMDDAIRATLEIMDADPDQIRIRTSYNVAAISFSAEELAREIQQRIPDFAVTYQPDFRQQIADSWPRVIDDSMARRDWGWKHEYDLARMTEVMLREVGRKLL